VGGSIYTSHTSFHLQELCLDTQKAHTALKLHAHFVLYAHKLTTTRCALEKSSCSQGLGLEQGWLVTLQILTGLSFSMVEETHGSLGRRVSFSLIDVGNGFNAYVVSFLFFRPWEGILFLFFTKQQVRLNFTHDGRGDNNNDVKEMKERQNGRREGQNLGS